MDCSVRFSYFGNVVDLLGIEIPDVNHNGILQDRLVNKFQWEMGPMMSL